MYNVSNNHFLFFHPQHLLNFIKIIYVCNSPENSFDLLALRSFFEILKIYNIFSAFRCFSKKYV